MQRDIVGAPNNVVCRMEGVLLCGYGVDHVMYVWVEIFLYNG